MGVSSITGTASFENLQTVQTQSHLAMVKRTQDLQLQQAQQLLQSLAPSQQPRPIETGQPGGLVDTYA